MRFKTTLAITAGIVGLATSSAQAQYAQYVDDSFTFSQTELGATARFKGLGGAQTALGGDLSNIWGNPAGLGFFNRSDAGISFDYFGTRNSADFLGTNTLKTDNRVGLNNAGIVFNLPTYKSRGSNLETGWLNFNIGLGYAKTNNLSNNLGIYGVNNVSSFVDNMSGGPGAGYLSEWGYDSYLTGTYLTAGSDVENFFPGTALPNEGFTDIISRGRQSETSLSFGANHSNTFYIGGSLNFSSIRSRKQYRFEEYGRMYNQNELQNLGQIVNEPNIDYVDYLDSENYPDLYNVIDADYQLAYGENTIQNGNGFSAKLGFIYRPIDAVRIGFTATTPTWYSISETFEDSFSNDFFDPNTGQGISFYEVDWYPNVWDYRLRTPYRLNAGLATVFGGGLISADVEYVDYKNMQFSSNEMNTDRLINDEIQNTYKGALNFRIGAEYLIAPQLALRAGYNHRGNAYQSNDFSSASQTISGGLGYRYDNFYIDATYQNIQHDAYNIGAYANSPDATVNVNRNNVHLTLGVKF